MRTGTVAGRLVVAREHEGRTHVVDVAEASGGRFSADPADAFARWDELVDWTRSSRAVGTEVDMTRLGPPVPRPRQVFAIGLNYRSHAAETDQATPDHPPTFTKFPSCLAGPVGTLTLPAGSVDWEVELVVAMGRETSLVAAGRAWSHVAGLMVGQDYSEREQQTSGPVPQFSLAKSHPGFGPVGPFLTTTDEVTGDPDDLLLETILNGETVQKDRTASMIFSVPELLERLSRVVTLYPGDLVFTGTPAGVGMAREPAVFLRPGDEVISRITGLGELRQVCA